MGKGIFILTRERTCAIPYTVKQNITPLYFQIFRQLYHLTVTITVSFVSKVCGKDAEPCLGHRGHLVIVCECQRGDYEVVGFDSTLLCSIKNLPFI